MGSAVTGAVSHLRHTATAECLGDQDPGLNPSEGIAVMTTPEQKKSNVRLGLILGSIAVVVFIGFVAKSALLGI